MSEPKKCAQCNGSGKVTIDTANAGPVQVMCGVCMGKGFVILKEGEDSEELLLLD